MKKLLLTLLCISTVGAAFPAFAGPDGQMIDQARKAKEIQLAQAAPSQDHQTGMDGKMDHQMDPKMHEKMEQMMMDCMDGMDMKDHQAGMDSKMDPKMHEKMHQMMMDRMGSKDKQSAMDANPDQTKQRRDLYSHH